MKYFNYASNRTPHMIAVLLLLPAVLAGLIVEYDPPVVLDLFAYGGSDVFVYNLCILILTPYFVIFLLALGGLYVSRLPNEDLSPLKRSDLRLIAFFVGCGILTILGFTLGLLKLLYFWPCFPIFVIVIYFYFLQPRFRETAADLWDWMRGHESNGSLRFAGLIVRIVLIAVVASIVLSRGILLELFKDGGLHQYFAYFAETRLYHSTWMDPSHPILFDYLAGRGQGVYLFFTSFTNQFTIQIIGAIYLIMIGVIARQVIELMLSIFGPTDDKFSLHSLLPDLVMLLVLTSPILDMETARFHLQTGVFFLFLAWAGSLFLVLEGKQNRWLYLSLIPMVIAFPIIGGIFYAFVGWILGIIVVSLVLTRKTAALKYPLLLLVIGGASTILSFSLNWLYVGIPEIQPARAFIPFIWIERFGHWSSRGLITYLYLTFDQTVSAGSISIQQIGSNALVLFSYPLSMLTGQDYYSKLPVSYYSILLVGIFVWIAILYLSRRNTSEEAGGSTRKYFLYWLTFTSLYVLKFLITSIIQQGSLRRMFLFMDVFPIITFFSMVIFLLHMRAQSETREAQTNFSDRVSAFLDGNKSSITVGLSILWGGCFALALANPWPYFWRRSLPIQLLLLALFIAAGAVLLFPFLKKIFSRYDKTPKKEILRLMISLAVAALALTSLVFRFAPLTSHIPVSHTLKISVVKDTIPALRPNAVKLLDVIIDDKAVELKSLEGSGDWVRRADVMEGRGQAELTYVYSGAWDSTVEVVFETGPSVGSVQVEYDNREPIIKDLGSDEQGTVEISISPSLFDNPTSLLLASLLFGAEFAVIFGLVHLLLFVSLSREVIYASAFLLFGLTLTYFQFRLNPAFAKMNGGWQYFTGRQGAIKAYDPQNIFGVRSDVFHCLEILEKVPGSAAVFNLNGLGAVEPCLFSPLLPRDKIVHYYESLIMTEPYYENLMFGEPQAAYQIYRDLGINYFYFRKGDHLFVNLAYGRALEPQNLGKYFDVYAEADDFYILTWQGEGLHPVSAQLEREISILYEHSKENALPPWWLGREGLEAWIQTQP